MSKKVTVFQPENEDMTIIFTYENGLLSGMNFHMGQDEIDSHYFSNNQELLEVYLNRCKLDYNREFNQEVFAVEAIWEYHEKREAREKIEYELGEVDGEVEGAFEALFERFFGLGGDSRFDNLSDYHKEVMETIKEGTKELIKKIIKDEN